MLFAQTPPQKKKKEKKKEQYILTHRGKKGIVIFHV